VSLKQIAPMPPDARSCRWPWTPGIAPIGKGEHIAVVADGSAPIAVDYVPGNLTVVGTTSGWITCTIGADLAGQHILEVIGVPADHRRFGTWISPQNRHQLWDSVAIESMAPTVVT
jgi:hypothetical protein